jgi:ribonuclease HII
MGLIIGMDEAGYGPNLGPLVVTAVAWQVPDHPRQTDLWQEFAGIVDQTPPEQHEHLHLADSKQVYQSGKGLAALEQGVLAALALHENSAGTFHELWRSLAPAPPDDIPAPWFADHDLDLPHQSLPEQARTLRQRWRDRCLARGIRLAGIRSDVVSPQRFNRLTRDCDSKGRALTQISMNLIRQLWSVDSSEPALILADKHGGRNAYHEFVQDLAGDRLVMCHSEGTDSSRYRVSNSEFRFEAKGERHLPVALASMFSKYLRELSMVLFNRYWTSRLPDLKPTAGYPGDARRFREEIRGLQESLAISDEVLWRER